MPSGALPSPTLPAALRSPKLAAASVARAATPPCHSSLTAAPSIRFTQQILMVHSPPVPNASHFISPPPAWSPPGARAGARALPMRCDSQTNVAIGDQPQILALHLAVRSPAFRPTTLLCPIPLSPSSSPSHVSLSPAPRAPFGAGGSCVRAPAPPRGAWRPPHPPTCCATHPLPLVSCTPSLVAPGGLGRRPAYAYSSASSSSLQSQRCARAHPPFVVPWWAASIQRLFDDFVSGPQCTCGVFPWQKK